MRPAGVQEAAGSRGRLDHISPPDEEHAWKNSIGNKNKE